MKAEFPTSCPKCSGEITFSYGLAGGGPEPAVYWLCLDCDWMGPQPDKTVCFPHGLVKEPTGA